MIANKRVLLSPDESDRKRRKIDHDENIVDPVMVAEDTNNFIDYPLRVNEYGESEEAFFTVLFMDDIWVILKTHMYPGKKTSSIDNYKNADCAAYHGYLKIFEERGESLTHIGIDTVRIAANRGHLDVLRWIHDNGKGYFERSLIDTAVRLGYIDIVKWLYENKINDFRKHTMGFAAANGHLEIVKWLHYNGARCTKFVMDIAASDGHLDTVIWLHENRTEGCTWRAVVYAAVNGHLEVVIWVWDNCNITDHDCDHYFDRRLCLNLAIHETKHALQKSNVQRDDLLAVLEWLKSK